MKVLDSVLRRLWLLGVPLGIVAAVVVILIVRSADGSARADEVTVDQATLRPGQILLDLVNGSAETARVAQVIVNDSYADFRISRPALQPDDAARVTVSYPWIEGESYEVELLMSPDGAVLYEIEEADVGTQTAEAA
jgi:ZIP family zinc transporter